MQKVSLMMTKKISLIMSNNFKSEKIDSLVKVYCELNNLCCKWKKYPFFVAHWKYSYCFKSSHLMPLSCNYNCILHSFWLFTALLVGIHSTLSSRGVLSICSGLLWFLPGQRTHFMMLNPARFASSPNKSNVPSLP